MSNQHLQKNLKSYFRKNLLCSWDLHQKFRTIIYYLILRILWEKKQKTTKRKNKIKSRNCLKQLM